MLILADRDVLSKKLKFLSLLFTKNQQIIMPNIFTLLP